MKKINFKNIAVAATRKASLANKSVAKNSPLILTVLGVVGLGATAWLSFKAAKRVNEITDQLEYDRNKDAERKVAFDKLNDVGYDNLSKNDQNLIDYYRSDKMYEPVNRAEVAKELIGATALPVATGLLSISAIALSYYIMNNRVLNLAASLAAASAESAYYNKKYKEQYGQEAYDKFTAPVEERDTTVRDDNGEERPVHIVTKRKKGEDLEGRWFSNSTEYAADDMDYNRSYIRSISDKLVNKKFRNGYLVMNDVLDELGFERSKAGALMGWGGEESFDLFTNVYFLADKDGEKKPEIRISWPHPHYIYDSVEFKD